MPPVTVHPPPTSGSSNGSSRNYATTETGPQLIPEHPRKRRGPTQGFQTAHIVKVTQQKLEVIIEKKDMRATGPNAPRFANEIGAAVRQYAPLNKIWWKDVTDAEKSPMYSRLENVFVLDYDKRPWIKEVIENDMPIRFKEFRYELHEYYETLIDLPMAEMKAKKHDQVLNQDYWDFLCDYWESQAFKKKSKRNATNRAKLTHGHCSGSRSFLNTQAMRNYWRMQFKMVATAVALCSSASTSSREAKESGYQALPFTAGFAYVLVKQKFTAFSINAIVLLTAGTAVLALHTSGDRPEGVSKKDYALGFVFTLAGAASVGFMMPFLEFTYLKARQAVTYTMVLEIQLVMCFFATAFCIVGMIINKDFQAITRDAIQYELGETKYYLVLVGALILLQGFFVGIVGVIFYGSSLLSGVIVTVSLPITEHSDNEQFGEAIIILGNVSQNLQNIDWGIAVHSGSSLGANKTQQHFSVFLHEPVHFI
ncbi:Uncharacterized protein Fot_29271 [Forsythia ovata]|uniref:Probable purine permease n=1 Tax=Forsythia ovata TaxID=205694 RepID=A0ABD1TS75_9LAMI